MSSTAHQDDYYLPEPSYLPIIAVAGIFTLFFGTALAINGVGLGSPIVAAGLLMIAYMFFDWFRTVIDESETGKYNVHVDRTFRQSMIWFIGSEAFFFLTFFGCLFYLRNISMPWLGGDGQLGKSNMLWDGFKASWPLLQLPAEGTKYIHAKEAMGPWGLPAINTLILLSSGVTVTWAHWGLKNENRKQLIWGLAATVALGVLFLLCQAYEYIHAYHELDLTLKSGIYGSTFFLLTGFHGMHVTLGTLMLMVILGRSMKGHFSAHKHFAFEGVAWYWHFVDVVWLALFVFVYWL